LAARDPVTGHVLAFTVDVQFPRSQSLKEKRSQLRPVIEGARNRFCVSVAETDHQDTWQRSEIVFVVVSSNLGVAEQQVDEIARFVWSFPELAVLHEHRQWMEMD